MPDGIGTGGIGRPRIFLGTDQAAGSEISEVVPAGKFWQILALRAQLVTSATVANRFPRLELDDGANIFYNSNMAQAQAASLTVNHAWALGEGANPSAAPPTTGGACYPLANLVLGPGYRIKTVTVNFQAGDNWGAPVFYVAEFDFSPF